MGKRTKILAIIILAAAVIGAAVWFLRDANFAVLNPRGTIANQQRNLIIFAAVLSLVVLIPVYVLTFTIIWRYRASNTKAEYRPDWDHSRKLEAIWWLIPLSLIVLLSVVTWKTSHSLDPFRPLNSNQKPLTVQVVALQWKWLFLYPEQQVASVNYLQLPINTPINFEITSDAPMNSFWIPQLGGQIYAMSGMSTQLHLMASQPGDYTGYSANISGKGFADMHFITRASDQSDFDKWVSTVRSNNEVLDDAAYSELAKPSVLQSPKTYRFEQPDMYNMIVTKFMLPSGGAENTHEVHL